MSEQARTEPEPTPVIPVSESSYRRPPGTAAPEADPARPGLHAAAEPSGSLADRPEVMAGAAFAGGLVLAILLRRLAD